MIRASEPPMKERRCWLDLNSRDAVCMVILTFGVSILLVSQRGHAVSILKVSIRQIKAARALLGWSQEDLARISHVSLPTIKRLETGEGPLGGRTETVIKLVSAIEHGGVDFIDENGGGRGVRLRKRQRLKH
jgi:DNA-binding XRE family transcriptional regulator